MSVYFGKLDSKNTSIPALSQYKDVLILLKDIYSIYVPIEWVFISQPLNIWVRVWVSIFMILRGRVRSTMGSTY